MASSSNSADTAPAVARKRPLGVTIIAVLAAISGMLGLLGSLMAVAGVAIVLLLAISILLLVFAYGAWTLQPWAWTLGVVLEVIGVVVGLYELFQGDLQAIFNVSIAAIVLYYLLRPEVKAAFRKA